MNLIFFIWFLHRCAPFRLLCAVLLKLWIFATSSSVITSIVVLLHFCLTAGLGQEEWKLLYYITLYHEVVVCLVSIRGEKNRIETNRLLRFLFSFIFIYFFIFCLLFLRCQISGRGRIRRACGHAGSCWWQWWRWLLRYYSACDFPSHRRQLLLQFLPTIWSARCRGLEE